MAFHRALLFSHLCWLCLPRWMAQVQFSSSKSVQLGHTLWIPRTFTHLRPWRKLCSGLFSSPTSPAGFITVSDPAASLPLVSRQYRMPSHGTETVLKSEISGSVYGYNIGLSCSWRPTRVQSQSPLLCPILPDTPWRVQFLISKASCI